VACAWDGASSAFAAGELPDTGCPAETREGRGAVLPGCTLTAKASASGISWTVLVAEEIGAAAGATGSSAGGSPTDGPSTRLFVKSESRFATLYTGPAPEPGDWEGPIDGLTGTVGTTAEDTMVADTIDGTAAGGVGPGAAGVFDSSWDERFPFASSTDAGRSPRARDVTLSSAGADTFIVLVEALPMRPCLAARE
jgi:hypothetical protein